MKILATLAFALLASTAADAQIHLDVTVGGKTPKVNWAKGSKPAAPDPMKVVKIFFKEPDLYLHGTGDEHLLGDPASHGCIRMAPADAYALARLIQENGGATQTDEWYQSVISGSRAVTVKLSGRSRSESAHEAAHRHHNSVRGTPRLAMFRCR